jgi:hypothetical protein
MMFVLLMVYILYIKILESENTDSGEAGYAGDDLGLKALDWAWCSPNWNYRCLILGVISD